MGVALIDAVLLRTVHPLPASIAYTYSPLAQSSLATVILADSLLTLFPPVPLLTVAVPLMTDALAMTVSRTDPLGTVYSSESRQTLALAIDTVAIAPAVSRTVPHTAVHLFVVGVAETEPVLAQSMSRTTIRTGRITAVFPDEPLGALTLPLHADTMVGTVIGTVLIRAV